MVRTVFKAQFLHLKARLLEEVRFLCLRLNCPRSSEQCFIILLMLPVVSFQKSTKRNPLPTVLALQKPDSLTSDLRESRFKISTRSEFNPAPWTHFEYINHSSSRN